MVSQHPDVLPFAYLPAQIGGGAAATNAAASAASKAPRTTRARLAKKTFEMEAAEEGERRKVQTISINKTWFMKQLTEVEDTLEVPPCPSGRDYYVACFGVVTILWLIGCGS